MILEIITFDEIKAELTRNKELQKEFIKEALLDFKVEGERFFFILKNNEYKLSDQLLRNICKNILKNKKFSLKAIGMHEDLDKIICSVEKLKKEENKESKFYVKLSKFILDIDSSINCSTKLMNFLNNYSKNHKEEITLYYFLEHLPRNFDDDLRKEFKNVMEEYFHFENV